VKLEIVWTTQFKKDYKAAQRQGKCIDLLDKVIRILAAGEALPAKFRDHLLVGNFIGYHECHLQGDWLLVYKIDEGLLVLTLARTGSHSKLF